MLAQAVLLIVAYALGMLFSLKTHREFFASAAEMASAFSGRARTAMRVRLLALPEAPPRARLHPDDWLGAAGVFLLVFLSTLPVAIPFMVTGVAFGRMTGRRPAVVGIVMVVLGTALVGMTMALGG